MITKSLEVEPPNLIVFEQTTARGFSYKQRVLQFIVAGAVGLAGNGPISAPDVSAQTNHTPLKPVAYLPYVEKRVYTTFNPDSTPTPTQTIYHSQSNP